MSKSIFISGVSTGIGYNLCSEFLKNDYLVYGSVRKQTDADKLTRDFPVGFTPVLMDVTQPTTIKKAASIVAEALNGKTLSGLINNAGILVSGPMLTLTLKEYHRQFDVNFFGVIEVTKQFLPLLGTDKTRNGKKGKIINISSTAGQVGAPFIGAYCASKFALEGMSNSLRRELLLYGIDVIIIGLGAIKTSIWEKESATTIPKAVLNSDYSKSMSLFNNRFREEGVNGMDADKACHKIYKIFEKKKPKTRYAIARRVFAEWTVLRYLIPNRTLDKLMKRMFK